uniref:Uncharacterized protein n=1 Tax=Glossina austeni TaxID=7395 RepID=A0A1A9V2L9_GLOAU
MIMDYQIFSMRSDSVDDIALLRGYRSGCPRSDWLKISPDRVGIKKGANLVTFGGHLGLLRLLMMSKCNRFCHFGAGRLDIEITLFGNCRGLINATAMMEPSRCERINAIPSNNRIVLQGSSTLALPKFLLKVSVTVLKALKEQSSPDDKIVEPLCPW